MSDRRAFLKFLAASPLFAGMPAMLEAFAEDSTLASAAAALDVFDFEAPARKIVPPAHWGYLATGVDGEDTIRANREGFTRYQLRPRRFVDVSRVDMSTELLGMKLTSPIVLCPVGSQKAFHAEGEVAAARAAKTKGQLQIMSTQSSSSVEDVIKARGGPIWYQLYTTDNFDVTTKLVKRAEAAGCPVVAVTVDLPAGRNVETAARLLRQDTRVCANCHTIAPNGVPQTAGPAGRPMFAGINTQGLATTSPSLTWDFIKRLRDVTSMKIVIKGLETREDAALAVEHGADGIVVSNHGGRATESGRGTVESLPEVVQAVAGRVPVIMDGGVRRGTDVFKALALGASAVGIGRPYIWGLACFGQQGVERVLDILNNELRLAMVGCGTRSIKEITSASLVDTGRRADRRIRTQGPRIAVRFFRREQMKRLITIAAVACVAAATAAFAQLVEPNQVGVRMGHVHLAVSDVEAQKQFWVSVMGGTIVKNGSLELIQFPGVFIMLRQSETAAPPAGSIVDHFGFVVKDMPAALARWKAAGVKIDPTENPNEVYVLAPDGIRLEVYGEPALPTPVSMNHIHFFPADAAPIKAWYVKAFGANPGRRPCVACLAKPRMIEADDLPGVNLSFSPGAKPPMPSKGRAIDHIGFEVDNLEAFVATLAAKGIQIEAPIRQVQGSKAKVAFLTDPFGTYIELTEGLAPQ